jgi:hypothetical protein
MKKIAILGCGQLGSIVADAIASGLLPDYTLCAAMSRKLPDAEALCAKAGGAACVTLDEVLAQKPDYVVETAAVQVAKESCLPVLEAGLGFIPISIGAFADADFYAKACAAAKAHGGRIYLRTTHLPPDLPAQVVVSQATEEDISHLRPLVEEYCRRFQVEKEPLLASHYYVLRPNTKNPYKQLYVNN